MLARNPLARIRQNAGLKTAGEAARCLFISRVHLLNIERGRNGASEELIARMAKLYSTTATDIQDAIRRGHKSLLKRMLKSA
jgi:transcriptional regulator with XRE-family HTH domain